jgi:uncharacterized membrane protein YraQ (UPF0718 family)
VSDDREAAMTARNELRTFLVVAAGFLCTFFLPVQRLESVASLPGPIWEALYLVRWYAREHVLLCLVPAFFIAGAISVFVSQASVLKYLGARANKVLAYGVASVSGTILAVCSCTVLPLFAGIYKMGAGLGPASAFLYSGPAINVLAIILTARILGPGLGIARAVGAVLFSIVIGLLMHLIFRKEELAKKQDDAAFPEESDGRTLVQNALYFGSMVGILVFANWGRPAGETGVWHAIYAAKWWITGAFGALFAVVYSSVLTRRRGETGEWVRSSWGFGKQILPLLLIGVLAAGVLLGRPGEEGLIPARWIGGAVGGNSLGANLFASVAGAFMYFATLTEVPILQGLIGSGMGKGPALALLLAGPALSLPNMLVIRSVMGTTKTLVFIGLVVVMATLCGIVYGAL